MSKSQRRRRLRRRQIASQPRGTSRSARGASVAITGSLLTTAGLAGLAAPASAAVSDLQLVADLTPGTSSSYFRDITAAGSKLFFTRSDSTSGRELWVSDGTAAGTKQVKDIVPGDYSSYPDNLTAVGSTLYFTAQDETHGTELWKSDGTAAGTVLVKDVNAEESYYDEGVTYSSSPAALTAVGSTLYFSANDGTDRQLWKSDGTAAGTVEVSNITSSYGYYSFDNMTAVGSTLFFTFATSAAGEELWKSDGTTAGTSLVKDIRPGSSYSSPSALTAVGSTLFFTANDGSTGRELWKSDGTTAGTVLVKDTNPTSTTSSYYGPSELTASGSTLFFTANDGTSGRELWKSDGTTAGTSVVADLDSGSSYSSASNLVAFGTGIAFTNSTSQFGTELWKSDGTAAGTGLVADINVSDYYGGAYGSNPRDLTVLGSSLFFTANDGISGRELWKSDGTDAGTGIVGDLRPSSASSYYYAPTDLTVAGTTLFFTADNGVTGNELWKTTASATSQATVVNQTAPVITGTPRSGAPLAASNGTWATPGVTFTYQWYADGRAVRNATKPRFRPGTGEVGSIITVRVVARAAGLRPTGSLSAPSAPVLDDDTIVNITAPSVSGTAKVGTPLTANKGTWSPDDATYTYQWAVGGTNVSGATGTTYTPAAGDIGKTVTVTVTASSPGLTSTSRTSDPSAAVAAGTFALGTKPKISGQAKVGKTLRVSPGTVAPGATRVSFAWLRNGKAIGGATKSTYKLAKADKGKKISVKVTYTRAGYTTAAATSAATGKVAK